MIVPGHPLTETDSCSPPESKLYNHTGVFDWAEVDPRRQITTQTSEDVLVKVHEAKRNQMTYGIRVRSHQSRRQCSQRHGGSP